MLLLGALMPLLASGLWLWWIYHMDRHEKEPWGLVLQTLGLGAVAGIVSLAIQLAFSGSLRGQASFGEALLGALLLLPFHLTGIAGVMYYLPFHRSHWNEPFDGLVYGGAAGIGYGFTYTLIALLRSVLLGFRVAIFSIPVYMLAGVIIGHFMSRVKFGPPRRVRRNWVRGLGLAGLFLVGIEASQIAGGQVVTGNMVAGMFAYGANTLGWILATSAMAQAGARPSSPRLPTAAQNCGTCGSPALRGARYCYRCGDPLKPRLEGGPR